MACSSHTRVRYKVFESLHPGVHGPEDAHQSPKGFWNVSGTLARFISQTQSVSGPWVVRLTGTRQYTCIRTYTGGLVNACAADGARARSAAGRRRCSARHGARRGGRRRRRRVAWPMVQGHRVATVNTLRGCDSMRASAGRLLVSTCATRGRSTRVQPCMRAS